MVKIGFLTTHIVQVHHMALLKIKIPLPGLNVATEQREKQGESHAGRGEVEQGEADGWGGERQEKDKALQGQGQV